MTDLQHDFHPMMEERRLKELRDEARKQQDRDLEKGITKKLVKLYVSQGEYFKMADQPDPKLAKRYLEKALRLQDDHPVANYRLGYLSYRDRQYTRAAAYFERALDGSMDEELNDTQRMLAHMFLVNCGIKIAKEAISEVQYIEDNLYSDLENERIERYKQEILILNEDIFDRMFYRKVENGNRELIGEYEFIHFEPKKNQVLLKSSEQGMQIQFQHHMAVPLNPKAFYVLYGILTANSLITYQKLRDIASDGSGQEVSDDYIRQIIRRLSRDLPYWDSLFETTTVLNEDTRRNVGAIKLAEGYTACIFCRVEDYLPV